MTHGMASGFRGMTHGSGINRSGTPNCNELRPSASPGTDNSRWRIGCWDSEHSS
jgi:hypothetical protein